MHEPGPYQPYQSETDANTSTTWLNDMDKVDAKLDGMTDYAQAVMTIWGNLLSHKMRITSQMGDLVMDAFQGGFPEITYAQTVHGRNLGEFNSYLKQLADGLEHTANAAKAVADAYGGQDGFSAIDLNAVEFAFGMPGAQRPDGLPARIDGKTFFDREMEQAAAAAKNGTTPVHADSTWVKVGETTRDGVTTMVFHDQYGATQTMTVTTDANGHKTTTIVGPAGTTTSDESTFSYPYGTTTTTTSTNQPTSGKATTSTSTTSTYSSGYGSTSTTSTDGQVRSQTTTTYGSDGSRTDTTYSVGSDGKRTESGQVTVGQDNDANEPHDSPAGDAMKQYQPDNQTLAPGPIDGTGGSGSSTGTATV